MEARPTRGGREAINFALFCLSPPQVEVASHAVINVLTFRKPGGAGGAFEMDQANA